MITLMETGLRDRVDCVRSLVAYAADPNPQVLADNPLGKIPALVLDDGTCLFDSPVICEYLDSLAGGDLLPASGPERLRQLRWQALGDGITDMLLLWRNEQMRPGGEWTTVTAAFAVKLRAAMARLDAEAAALTATPFGLGQIALICALGQLDFRFPENHWHAAFPALAAWHAKVSQRPSVAATVPQDDPSPVATRAGFDAASPIDFRQPG